MPVPAINFALSPTESFAVEYIISLSSLDRFGDSAVVPVRTIDSELSIRIIVIVESLIDSKD